MTVAELFKLAEDKPDEFWDILSDGEFKMKSLFKANYPAESWRQLQWCCWQVIKEHGNRLADRYALGNIMGDAMEMMAGSHNLRVPKAWLPVMRELRKGGPIRYGKPSTTVNDHYHDFRWDNESKSFVEK